MIRNSFRTISSIALAATALVGATSCQDFFETDSTHVIFDGQEHIKNANDTIYSLVGVLNKLQAIADRTVLLGEVRGDLMDVTEATTSDLRDVAFFNIGSDNKYNSPRDYYAIINNCNYYIAHADAELKNNRNEYLFLKEYAAIKAIRAWTYLQLVLNYGHVPFVTQPILTKEQAERDYPIYGIQQVCDYFLHDDDLAKYSDVPYPGLGLVKGLDSRLFYFPVNVVLGDLNLWAGNYLESARCYYDYISKRNGTNTTYVTGNTRYYWLSNTWSSHTSGVFNDSYGTNQEMITVIPGDSIPSEGYYSDLRNIFNSESDNDYKCSLVPSQGMFDISEAQTYAYYDNASSNYILVPHSLDRHRSGDLRLSAFYSMLETDYKGNHIEYQTIWKHLAKSVRIYRRTLVYLRMAEALNRAGYPRFAYQILSTGVNNRILNDSIIPAYKADSALLVQFDFPNTRCEIYDPTAVNRVESGRMMQGIHSRGCGYAPQCPDFQMPYNPAITDSLEQIAWQQLAVEDMIMDEEALEFAFEGHRFYDLMRVALRRNNPSYLADRIYRRRGEEGVGEMQSMIAVDLKNPANWYLNWNGQIGY